jgi:excisionase family DNA binding protein
MTSERRAAENKGAPKPSAQRKGETAGTPEHRIASAVRAGARHLGSTSNTGEFEDSLLDYAGAARYLCTTPRHIRELWAKRYLAAIKVGRCVRFSKKDLDAFISARRVRALR